MMPASLRRRGHTKASPPASAPDLLTRPPPRPCAIDEVILADAVFGWAELDQILDLEPVGAQEPNPVAVTEMELDRRVVGPLEPVHAEVRTNEAIGGRDAIRVGGTQHQQRAVAEEEKLAAGMQKSGRLGDPVIGVRPDGGTVLADDEIEGPVPERHLLPARAYERKPEPELGLKLFRDAQLSCRRIDTGGKSTQARQPCRDIGRAAA